jgi:hypothetical protein
MNNPKDPKSYTHSVLFTVENGEVKHTYIVDQVEQKVISNDFPKKELDIVMSLIEQSNHTVEYVSMK